MSDADDLTDLIGFLGHTQPQIQQQAVTYVQGLTGSPQGIAQLAARADTLLPPLLRLLGAGVDFSGPALTALVNLSQEPPVQQKLLSLNAPARCMDYLRERSCLHPDLLIMLLANLTAAEEGAAALLQQGKGDMAGVNIAVLLKLFLAPVGAEETDTYAHVATILPNVTRFKEARQVLLEPGRGTLGALASQLRSASELRRRGCARAIKNCCFSCEGDGTVEAIADDSDALGGILDVLCGESRSEPDGEVAEALAEAVACLAKAPAGRKQLWKANAPELLRKAYEFEERAGVCEAMESAATSFLQDGFQPAEEGGDAQGNEEDASEHAEDLLPPGRQVQIEELD